MEQIRYGIGIATLAIVAVVAWFLLGLLADDDLTSRFQVTLAFEDVRGLRAGADVRYRGVRVGEVQEVGVAPDGEKATVRVVFDERVEHLACTNSRFWIVSPRFHGLTSGATGLDTLVRDTYVAFLTPTPSGPRLAHHSLLAGLERPFVDPGGRGLDPVHHGDLLMHLHAAESHGIDVGAEVRFRGMRTGDVRRVELAEDGSHVVFTLRIQQTHRHTVTSASEFWIARPRLSGALISGLAIEDLEALLSPFVGYHGAHGAGVPVPDGHRAIAVDARPELEAAGFAIPEQPPRDPASAADQPPLALVEVVYEAVEEDWLSADDRVKRESTGLLFVDRAGRAVVVTSRSACDAGYFMSDAFGGSPDIASEAIRVLIPGGTVFRAGRSWVDPTSGDLALLVVEDAPPDLHATAADLVTFEAGALEDVVELRGCGADTEPFEAGSLPAVDERRGWVATVGGRAVAVVGQRGGRDEATTLVPLDRLPEELRPRR